MLISCTFPDPIFFRAVISLRYEEEKKEEEKEEEEEGRIRASIRHHAARILIRMQFRVNPTVSLGECIPAGE